MASRFAAMALRPSALRAACAALHTSKSLHAAVSRTTSSFSNDLLADMGMDRPRPVAPERPPRGPLSWAGNENPVTTSRSLPKKVASGPPKYHFHAHFSSNNTKIYLADPRGRPLPQGWWSGGSCGFKGVNRSTHEAGYQCAVRAFGRIHRVVQEKGPIALAVHLKGFGKGRTAVEQIFLTSEGDKVRPLVVEVEDRTPIKIGGTRGKKARRL